MESLATEHIVWIYELQLMKKFRNGSEVLKLPSLPYKGVHILFQDNEISIWGT